MAERTDGVGVGCLMESLGLIPSIKAEVLTPGTPSREELIDSERLSMDMPEGVLLGLGSGPVSGKPRLTMGVGAGAECGLVLSYCKQKKTGHI